MCGVAPPLEDSVSHPAGPHPPQPGNSRWYPVPPNHGGPSGQPSGPMSAPPGPWTAPSAPPAEHWAPAPQYRPMPPVKESRPPVGALLAILFSLGALLCTFLPWYAGSWTVGSESDSWVYNGWQQVQVVLRNNPGMGGAMMASLCISALAVLLVLIGCIGHLTSGNKGMGALGLIGAIAGTLAGLGLVIGYLAVGATEAMSMATWGYGFLWLPALAGAIGMATRKF